MKKLFLLLTALLALTAVHAQDADSLYAKDLLKPGTEAPDFDLQTADGKHITLSSLRGNYVVLDFWASWCPDCRKDIPAVKALFEQHKGRNITFVGISFDTNKESWVKCYWDKYQMTWTQVSELKKWKKETTVDRAYHVNWIPTMYLIDPQGRVVLGTVEVDKLGKALDEIPRQLNNGDSTVLAEYPGGQEALDTYINRMMEYPLVAIKNKAEATVTCVINVEMDGAVRGARVIDVQNFRCSGKRYAKLSAEKRAEKDARCLDALKNEAVRVVSGLPKWKPGSLNGRPMQTQQTVKVVFRRK